MSNHSVIYPELKETTKAQIEVRCSYNGGFYLTTNEDLKGRGITQSGDGSDHKRNMKTYHATERALNILKETYSTCFIANL